MHSTVIKLIGEVLEEMDLVDRAACVLGIGCCGLDVYKRQAQMPGAYLPGHGVAVQAGHHHVQNQQVVDAQLRVFRPGLPVIDGLSLKARCV